MMARPLRLPAFLWLGWLALAAAGECAEPPDPTPSEPPPLEFRRMYAPAEHAEQWPVGDDEYWPVAAEEFERLLRAARAGGASAVPARVPRLAAAEYEARLVDGRWLEGQAALDVQYAGSEPGLLSLAPWGLALRGARWSGEPRAPADVGTGPDGAPAVLVEQSGRLELDWSLAAAADALAASEEPVFSFRLPPCPISRLRLVLPSTLSPQVDRGIITSSQGETAATRQWQIELGSYHRVELRLAPVEARPPASEVRLRETSVYEFSQHGLDLSAQWRLDVRNRPLRELALRLDRGLVLASARYGDLPVSWTEQTRRGGGRVVLELPEEVLGTGRTLRLRALAPPQLNRPWRLPQIQPEKVLWEEGTLTVLVPKPLVLRDVEPIGCQQIDAAPLAAPREGESARFRSYQQDATLRVELGRPEASIELVTGTQIRLSPGEATAEALASFRLAEGVRYSLEADLGSGWLVDSVESVPPGLVDSAVVQSPGENPRKLRIRLNKGLSSSQPIRLRVAARRFQLGTDLRWTLEELVPLQFPAAEQHRQLMAIEAVGPYRLKTSGAGDLRRVDRQELDASQGPLFSKPPGDLLFERDASAAGLQVELQARGPAYAGQLRVEATAAPTTATGATLRESYTLRFEPQETRVERLLVYFSHPREAPPRFSLAAEDGRDMRARRLAPEEQTAEGLPARGESWELTLERPRSVPFEIRAVRETELGEGRALSLIALPEASRQIGTLAVHSRGLPIEVINHRLEPVSAEAPPAEQLPTIRAAFRYDPMRDAAGAAEPAVTVAPNREAASPMACVWSCHLESRYPVEGPAQHRATYRVENSGSESLTLVLPAGVSLDSVRGVWLDGRPVGYRPTRRGLSVALPARQRFPTVAVEFSTPAEPLAMIGALSAMLPEVDLPVLTRQWTVWLPPDYATCGGELLQRPHHRRRRSWTQRLLGPLGRPSGEPAFDVTAAGDWLDWAERRAEARRAARHADQFLETIGSLAGEQDPPGPAFWGRLLSDPSLESYGPALLVDGGALARLGLGPESPLPPTTARSATDRGLRLLGDAELALLLSDEAAMLTSRRRALLDQDYLDPLGPPFVYRVRAGPLAEQMHRVAKDGETGGIATVESWRSDPPKRQRAWNAPTVAGFPASDALGWTVRRLQLPRSEPMNVRLRYVHQPAMRLLGWVALFAVVGLGWWLAPGRSLLLVGLLALAGCFALLVADPYVPIASGIVLGLVLCLAAELLRPRAPAGPSPEPPSASTPPAVALTSTHVWLLLAALACAAGLTARAGGQTVEPPPARPRQEPYRVFIPVDADRNPTGGRYQVPEPLYRELKRRAAGSRSAPAWLIGSARYRGSLSPNAAGPGFRIGELRVNLELRVFDPRTAIRIPVRRENLRPAPGSVLLDGAAVQPEWDVAGEALTFEVAEPGPYELELALRPTLLPDGGPGFDLAIPPAAASRLELDLPPGSPAVEVPTAHGLVRVEDEPPRLVAELGPADRLSVRYSGSKGLSSSRPAVEVDELLWMKVKPEPGSSVIDARFALRTANKELRQVRLALDGGLRLLEIKGEKPPKAKVPATRGQPSVIEFTFDEPVAGSAVIEARFLMSESPGAGRLSLPRIEVLDARSTRRWMGVSLDPRLERTESQPDAATAVAVPEFAAAWGAAEDAPQAAYALGSGSSAWSVAVRPREPETAVRHSLVLSFDRGRADVRLDAQLNTRQGYLFRHRVSLPERFHVEYVAIREEETNRVARWVVDREGRLVVFLSGPVAGEHTLSLRGRWDTQGVNESPLPEFAVEGARRESSTVEIFRRPGALVALSRIKPTVEVEHFAGGPTDADLGRITARLRSDSEQPIAATLSLAENDPDVRAEQLVRLVPKDGGWTAQFDCRLEINTGVLDEIVLPVPDAFHGPYQVAGEPPVDLSVVEQAEGRRLVLRPDEPIAAGLQFRVSSPLRVEPGRRPEVPPIELPVARELRRHVCLPLRFGQRTLGWETRGLRPATLPEGFLPPDDPAAFATFEAVGKPAEAMLLPNPPRAEEARVVLADVHLAWQADGTLHGVAAYDLEPGSATNCTLRLPAECRLVQATAGGIPVALKAARPNQYELSLGPQGVPQRIEVVFAGDLPTGGGAGSHTFRAPWLAGLPVERTLWTVAGPPSVRGGRPVDQEPAAAWTQDLARLKTVAGLIEAAASAEVDGQGTRQWYGRWIRRLGAARADLLDRLQRPGAVEPPETLRGILREIDQRQSQIAARLGASDLLRETLSGSPPAGGPAALWRQSLPVERSAAGCSVRGAAPSLTLRYEPVETVTWFDRLLAVAGLLAVAAGGAWSLRRGWLSEWFRRWPALFGVVFGLAWWLWLSPSLLGWGMVLASLAVSVLSAWRRSTPPPGSSVIALRSLMRWERDDS